MTNNHEKKKQEISCTSHAWEKEDSFKVMHKTMLLCALKKKVKCFVSLRACAISLKVEIHCFT